MKLDLKNVIEHSKGSLSNIFQDSLNKKFISTDNSWQILYIYIYALIDFSIMSTDQSQGDSADGNPKIKVLSRAPKVLPKPADRPITPVKAQIKQQRTESPSTDF